MRANQVARIVEQEPEKLKLPPRDSDFLPDVLYTLWVPEILAEFKLIHKGQLACNQALEMQSEFLNGRM